MTEQNVADEEFLYFRQNMEFREIFYSVRIFLDGIASNYCECSKTDRAATELKEHAIMLRNQIDAKVFHQSPVETP